MLQQKEYAKLERHLASLLSSRKKDSSGYSLLYDAYEKLMVPKGNKYMYDKWLGYYQDWLKHDNNSHFASTAAGMFYINYAWHARGSSWSSTVVSEGRKLFRERLEKAEEYLEKAYRLDNSDPVVPTELLVVARGLGWDRKTMEVQFARAIKADDTIHDPYKAKLTYLMPKWSGSEREMFAFARKAVRNAPSGTLIPLVLAKAHWEMYWRSDNDSYFKDRKTWGETRKVYKKILKDFPDNNKIRNWYARTAYLAADYETSQKVFNDIGDNWSKDCWDNKKYFQRIKNKVSGHAAVSANSSPRG